MGFAIAGLLGAAGVALELAAVRWLGWRRALDLSDAPPAPGLPALVLAGPFRLVRHPQSLGLLLILAAIALGAGTLRSALGAAVAGAVVVVAARREDRELTRRFGEAYARYQQAVPALVPRWPRSRQR